MVQKMQRKNIKMQILKFYFHLKKEFLKPEIVKAIDELEEATKDNTGLVVNFLLKLWRQTRNS